MSTVPTSGTRTPEATLIRVDLPDPFSPTRACTSPGAQSKSTSLSAFTPGNDFDTPASTTAGSVAREPRGGEATPVPARIVSSIGCLLERRNQVFRPGPSGT